MTRLRIFQFLVCLSFLMYIAWYFLPSVNTPTDPDVRNLLYADGLGRKEFIAQPWYYNSQFVLRVISTIALVFLLHWGRWLLIGACVLDLIATIFGGVTVILPLDATVLIMCCMLDGAVISMSFLGPVATSFRAMKRLQRKRPLQGL